MDLHWLVLVFIKSFYPAQRFVIETEFLSLRLLLLYDSSSSDKTSWKKKTRDDNTQIIQVFTALLSSLFLRRRLSVLQWLCVATISFGLILAVEQFNVTMESARSVINGMILTLVSCLFYSSNSVIADYLLSSTSTELQLPPPTGKPTIPLPPETKKKTTKDTK